MIEPYGIPYSNYFHTYRNYAIPVSRFADPKIENAIRRADIVLGFSTILPEKILVLSGGSVLRAIGQGRGREWEEVRYVSLQLEFARVADSITEHYHNWVRAIRGNAIV